LPLLVSVFFLPSIAAWLSGETWALVLAAILQWFAYLLLIPMAIAGSLRYRLSRTSWRGIRFSFTGHTKELFPKWLKWCLLTVVTLGFYAPFFDVRLREHVIERSRFGTGRFQYHGFASGLFPAWLVMIFSLGIGAVVCFLFLGVVGGIWPVLRTGSSGTPPPASKILLLQFAVVAVLYAVWGIVGLIYKAFRLRFHWGHTSFGPAKFRSTLRGRQLVKLWVVNILMLVFTLGLAWPWVHIRTMRLKLENLMVTEDPAIDDIEQELSQVNAAGEQAADFLDFDFGFL